MVDMKNNRDVSCFSADFISAPDFSVEDGGMYEFSLSVDLKEKSEISFLITADQYYRFFVDDEEIGRTLECGTAKRWFADKVTCVLAAGGHRLRAMVWHCSARFTAALLESHGLAFYLESSIENGK